MLLRTRYRENVSVSTQTPDTATLLYTQEFAPAIDRDAEVPIGVQLGWALRRSIAEGHFRAGQRLPGLRELAEQVGVNVNTVRAVYQRLERDGLLDSRQGSGTFVASTPPASSPVDVIAADAAREAQASGVDPREVAAALYVAPAETGPSPAGPVDEASLRRRALRSQIAMLERAIGELEVEHPGVAPRPTATRGGAPALLSVEALEQVRSGLVHRLATVQAAIDERAASAQPAVQGPVLTAAEPTPAKRRNTVALATP
jgi:DNA-binding transcriptional regulator YhcF (GntR family)